MKVGTTIKRWRIEKRLTLKALAELSGVALATLSRMENNKMTGTLQSHAAICRALGKRLPELYMETGAPGERVEHHQRKRHSELFVKKHSATIENLTRKVLAKKMLPTLLRIEPGCTSPQEQAALGIEKFIFVLQGRIEADVDRKSYFLSENDCLYFDGSLKHSFRNTTQQQASCLYISSPPAL